MSDQRLIRATALLFCLRFLAAFLIDLAPQETYYWNYAEHPALSYFDHPPMIAWVIGGSIFPGQERARRPARRACINSSFNLASLHAGQILV
jgi:hypothetical protein